MLTRRSPLLALCALLALTACGRDTEEAKRAAPANAGVLNIYTARHYDADQLIYDGFKQATGVEVRALQSQGNMLVEKMKAEGASSPADIILMADAGALWRAQEAGLFQPVTTPTLERRIPANLRDHQGRWWGFARRARVIAYAKDRVRPEEVASYAAVADPKFRGRVCVRNADNIYNLSMMAGFIERWGPQRALEWARGVVANMARKPQGGDIDQIRAVAAGACDVALANSYYFLRIASSEAPEDKAVMQKVAIAFPEQAGTGALVNISGGGVAAHAPNKENAVKFLEYLASDQAQAIFASANNEFPAVQAVKPPASVAAYANFKADPLPVTVYGRRQGEAQATFDQAGWQ
ncbi:MAG TPA: extracellular solute-binding protein [Caulobacteraceae bacterium]|jgi:iron(III) transport system substrate-binding protein